MNNGENIIVASVYRAPNTDLSLLNEYVEYILSNCNNKTYLATVTTKHT